MKIDDRLIEYIADLSRLELDPGEKEARKKDLEDILAYMEKLNEIDTTGMQEMTHPFVSENRFRSDTVTNEESTEKMLENAPDKTGPYFRVPRVVEE